MSIKDKMVVIGTTRSILINGLTIDVEVLDYKCSWGKDRWLVTPISGQGEIWVESFDSKIK